MTLALEPFAPGRTDELVRMWRESFEGGVGVIDPHPIAEQILYFEETVVASNTVIVAMLDGTLAGFVAANPESVSQLYVRRGLQRAGIGTRLLDWAKAQSAGSLWLYTFARNTGARAFYEKHGFTVAARGFEPTWQLDDLRYEWRRE